MGDGTPLDHEIEDWDSASGSLIAWVRLPTVSSTTDTSFHLYYGAANAADQQRPTAVWGDAEAVWHLDRDPAGSAPQLDDLSAHRRDGLSSGSMTSTDLVSGVAGKAIDFDGIDDVLQAQPFAVASDVLTLSAWVDFDSTPPTPSSWRRLARARVGATSWARRPVVPSGSASTSTGRRPSSSEARCPSEGGTTWRRPGTVPRCRSSSTARSWQAGRRRAPSGNSATMPVTVGNVPGNDRGVDGRIDEVRVESDFRPPWLLAAYRNQRPGSTFVSVGAHETGTWFAQGTWAYRSPIGVEIDPGASALTDFPLLVEFTSPDLVGATQLDGDDVVFTDRDGITRLDHQLESFDSGAGSVTAWVRVPSLDLDSQLFVYYGNPSAADQSDAENVFGDGADLVLHD
ncbi:MAG: DUF2341 domain-containing protein [Acidimicrobiales bacterium]